MKNVNFLVTILLSLGILLSCKKKDKTSPAPTTPSGPTETYNPPPSGGGYYFFINSENSAISWTKNFTEAKEYNSKLTGISTFGLGKDTLVVYKNGTIYFGNIYNPSDMKTITCSRYVQYLSCINNVVVCYAVDGNNYYLGYCDYKNGERAITFNFLTNGEYISGPIQHTGGELIASGYNNNLSVNFIAITRNGKNWSYKGLPSGVPSGNDVAYKNYNNTYYAISPYNFKFTNDTSFASGSWSSNSVGIWQNNSDTTGSFQSDVLRKHGTNWISYGNVYSTASGKYLAAKNVSTDNGVTFSTTLLNGLPVKQCNFAFTKTHILAMVYDDVASNGTYKTYISSDFLNFTQLNNANFTPIFFKEVFYIE